MMGNKKKKKHIGSEPCDMGALPTCPATGGALTKNNGAHRNLLASYGKRERERETDKQRTPSLSSLD